MKNTHPLVRLMAAVTLFSASTIAFADTYEVSPLVETDWLAKHMEDVVVLDIRTDKKGFVSTPAYHHNKKTNEKILARVGGHIPGAQFILYENVRDKRVFDGKTIKYMIIESDKFENIMQTAGVNQDSHIVITTNAESEFDLTIASRVYWQIKYYGHHKVSILNGGTAQWITDGREISSTAHEVPVGDWNAEQELPAIFADSHQVMAAMQNAEIQIVDIRPLGQYLGTFKSSKVTAKGHIPTAKVLPVDLLSSRDMPVKFSSKEELLELANALGIDSQRPLITYCNSGHMASGGWFVFHELLGNKQARLYDGSMHQWTHEGRPVVTMRME